jgi:hypothetical protein
MAGAREFRLSLTAIVRGLGYRRLTAGLWIPRKLRPPKIQHPRARRACLGELIQIDGCEHRWFEDRSLMCTAIASPSRREH